MKYFNKLSKDKQNDLRREYKQKHSEYYYHSIHLYILYVCLGIISILSLLIMIFLNKFLGITLFVLTIIIIIINIHYLSKSNLPFYKFLEKKGYQIKKK